MIIEAYSFSYSWLWTNPRITWRHFDGREKKCENFLNDLMSSWESHKQYARRYSSNFLFTYLTTHFRYCSYRIVIQRSLMMWITFTSSYLCSSIHNDSGQTGTANQINNVDEWMKTKHEKKKKKERELMLKVYSTYAHRTTTMKRIFFLFFLLFLSMKYFQQEKNERMPNSISILFHFLTNSKLNEEILSK
jgi:hypothetical protein